MIHEVLEYRTESYGHGHRSPVKTLREVRIARAEPDLLHPAGSYGELLHVHVRAESFLYHMVR